MTITSARTRVATVLAALIVTVTAACSSGSSLAGTEWVAEAPSGDQLIIAFTSDTDCELISVEGGMREVDDPEATWTIEDDIVSVTGDGSTFDFVLDGDTLTLTEGGQSLVFDKQ